MRIDYEKVVKKVTDISEIAQALHKCGQRIRENEEDCISAWKGEAAKVFVQKLFSLNDEMERTSRDIDDLAAVIRYCASRIQYEDEEVARKVKQF